MSSMERVCGGNHTIKRAVSSYDSKLLLVASGRDVLIYSTHTGNLVDQLLHHTDITGIVMDKQDHNQVFTASHDGTIALWNITKGELLKVINIGRPVLSLCIPHDTVQPLMYISVKNDQEKVAVFAIDWSTFTDHALDPSKDSPIMTLGKKSNELTLTYDSKYLVTSQKKDLVLHDILQKSTNKLSAKSVICSLACHPSKLCIATGTISGEILLWYDFNSLSNVVTSCLHWHAHAVADVCFSTDGTFLLSGGEESVLVLWQLANKLRHYRPRLGGSITGVACCHGDQMFAVSLKNNAVKLVSGLDNKVSHTLVQLYHALPGLDSKSSEAPPTGLVHDPRSHSIVLNGCPGNLQFFDKDTKTVKFQLEITQLNFVSRKGHTPIVPTVVSHVAFSNDGLNMATADQWSNDKITPERKLKFWKFDTQSQTYKLCTCIDSPHQGQVTCLSFRSSSREHESQSLLEVALTTSADGSFKIWTSHRLKNDSTSWICRSEGSYYSLPCKGGAFSEDGSLLALNYDKYITIWEPLTCVHRYSFNSPIPDDHFKQVTFGCHSLSHLLFASSDNLFHVWDLLTCQCVLTAPLSVDVLVADPYSSRVAVFTSTHLHIYSSTDSSPSVTVPSPMTSAVFIPVRKDGVITTSNLFSMDSTQVLYTLNVPNEKDDHSINVDVIQIEENGNYQNIFGKGYKGKMFSKDTITIPSNRVRTSVIEKGEASDEDLDEVIDDTSDTEVPVEVDDNSMMDEDSDNYNPMKEKLLKHAVNTNYNWLVDFLKKEL